jgi:hypothetical protein
VLVGTEISSEGTGAAARTHAPFLKAESKHTVLVLTRMSAQIQELPYQMARFPLLKRTRVPLPCMHSLYPPERDTRHPDLQCACE